MNDFFQFLRQNRHLLFFGLLLTYFSSFGQTFLISLYLPSLIEVFNFTNTGLSSLYAIATSASAFTLPWIGRLVDTYPLQRFTLIVIIGLTVACVLLSFAVHPIMILFGFWGLRLFGQGLMSHTSISTMARAFVQNRGKSISIASLGHPMGEATLPIIITLLIVWYGWRVSLQLSAVCLIILVLPLVMYLIRKAPEHIRFPVSILDKGQKTSKNPFFVLKDATFWIITPAIFITGFFNTALFFFQLKLGEARDWSPTWVAGSIAVYAIASGLAMMGAGPLVDRFSARKLFPFMLIPYLCGVCVIGFVHVPLIYPITLVLLALSNGAGGVIKNALFAEVFGTAVIGTVRSVFTTIMVFSTALGPLTFGIFLDNGWSFSHIFMFFAVVVGLIIAWSWRLR